VGPVKSARKGTSSHAVLNYHWVPESVLYILSVYAKNEMPNLPHAAYRRLKVLIEEEFKS
jgi:hypothetical protein